MKVPGNLFLIGMMGAGKTTFGRLLAKATNKHFYDSDQEVEKRTGVNILTIFEFEGELGFRNRESNILIALCKKENIVLATGGGTVLKLENREHLRHNGTVIYLRATADELFDRTCYSKTRPLLQVPDRSKQSLQQLLAIRDPLYTELAHIIIDTHRQPLQLLLAQSIKKLREHFGHG